MAVRPIVVYPHPVLTIPTHEVKLVDNDLRSLVADMIQTMHQEHGIGLAANQIGDSRRVTVIDLSGGEDPNALHVFVNPRVVEASGSQSGEEGCLSFPGIYEVITRPARVRMKGYDLEMNPVDIEAEELFARCIVHELDHLDGVTFLQRMSPLKRRLVSRRIERLKRDGEWPESAAQ